MTGMARDKDEDGLKTAPASDTERQLLADSFGSVMEFKKRTRVPLSMETCRRFFYEDMPVSATTYIIILKYLGLGTKEIKSRLLAALESGRITNTPHERIIAKDLAQLLSENAANLTAKDRAVVKIHRCLSKHKEANSACLDFLSAINRAYNLKLEAEIELLR